MEVWLGCAAGNPGEARSATLMPFPQSSWVRVEGPMRVDSRLGGPVLSPGCGAPCALIPCNWLCFDLSQFSSQFSYDSDLSVTC